jgi:hypothetical protein
VARRKTESPGLPTVPKDRMRCCWESNGEQCHYPGTLSRTTLGDGPWYCRWHFDCNDPEFGQRIVEDSRRWNPPEGGKLHPAAEAARRRYLGLT